MSSSNPQHEPTMEEILASIRKIISEDQPAPDKPKEEPKPSAAAAAPMPSAVEAEPEILELTDEVPDDEPEAPAPESIAEGDVVFEAIDDLPESQEEPAMDDDDLISSSTRHAVERVFDGLDTKETPSPSFAPAGGSVEAVFVRALQDAFQPTLQGWVGDHTTDIMDHLKPLIRQWMDENLPSIIESAVQREVARAVKARRR